jgi:putative transposase
MAAATSEGRTIRTFQAVLQPTRRQRVALEDLLRVQRELYNAALEERIGAWKIEQRSVSKFEQYKHLTGFDHHLLDYGVCPARGTLNRLDRAFQAFFRRVKAGGRPGFPRFKNDARFNTVSYDDRSCWRIEAGDRGHNGAGRVTLKGVGSIRFRGSRRGLRGDPRTLLVKRDGDRFTISVAYEHIPEPLPATGEMAGVDMGVTHLATLSTGEHVTNERHLRSSLDRLAALQARLAGQQRGSKRRRRTVAKIRRLHRKIVQQRRDAAHQLSRDLVDRFDVIVFEDLNIDNMTRRAKPKPDPDTPGQHLANGAAAKSGLNREILAAGWGQVIEMTCYKAEEAGRTVVKVNPRNTSRTCHRCEHTDPDSRAAEQFCCIGCGHRDHADVNAAKNILRAGLAHTPAGV